MSELVIRTIEAEIAQQKAKLAALEAALQALLPAYGGQALITQAEPDVVTSGGAMSTAIYQAKATPGRLTGKPVREAAQIVLSEAEAPLPARLVAQIALELGYRGLKADADLATATKTFNDIMAADKKTFTRLEDRRFALANRDERNHAHAAGPSRIPSFRPSPSMSRSDLVAAIIGAAGHPLTIKEILTRLAQRGETIPSDPRSAYNSLFGTLTNAKDRFKKVTAGQWDLIRDRLDDDPGSPNGRVENGDTLHR